jgi:hypothetical protein
MSPSDRSRSRSRSHSRSRDRSSDRSSDSYNAPPRPVPGLARLRALSAAGAGRPSRTRVVVCALFAMWAALGAPTLMLSAVLSFVYW